MGSVGLGWELTEGVVVLAGGMARLELLVGTAELERPVLSPTVAVRTGAAPASAVSLASVFGPAMGTFGRAPLEASGAGVPAAA